MLEMKKELEKFIIWYILFSTLTAIIKGFLLPYVMEKSVGSHIGSDVYMRLGFFLLFCSNFYRLVAPVWLWNQKKKENGRFILWALFGFCCSLWAVAFYVALVIFDEMKGAKTKITSIEQSVANQSVFTTP